jgi:HEAT repeat protein
MLHTRRPSGSARVRLWLLAAFAFVAGAVGPTSRGADPPANRIDDFRAAFQKDIDNVIWPRAHELPDLAKKVKDSEGDPDKKEDLAEAQRNLEAAKNQLTEALAQRDKELPDRIRAELAKADAVDRVAIANLIGDEAQRLPYPDTERLFALVPNYLAKLHPEIPFLVELTEPGPNNPLEVRLAATLALGKTKGDPAVVVPALAKILRNQRNPVPLRVAAAEALTKPIPYLEASVPLPQPGRTGLRTDTGTADRLRLILQDQSARAWPALLDGMNDPALPVRVASARSAKEISSALLDAARVGAPKEFLQEYANLVKAFREGMPKLATAVDDRDAVFRQLALGIVEDLATTRLLLSANTPPATLPPPRPMTRADRPRPLAALPDELPVALPGAQERGDGAAQPVDDASALPSAVKAILPALVRALKNPDVQTRRSAAFALEAAGEEAAGNIPDLAAGLTDRDRFVRWTLLRALGRLAPREPKVVVPAVIPRVLDPDIDVRLAAMKSLEAYGKDAVDAGPVIARLLPRGDTIIQLAGLKTIQAIGSTDAPTLATVATLLQNPEPNVRVSAAETLGRAGKSARSALPALERALEDEDEKVRGAASDALLRIKQ